MKYLAVILLIGIFFQAEAQDISGTWQIDIDNTLNAIPADRQAEYDSLSQEVKDQISAEMGSQQFVFNSNGDYETHSDRGSFTGSWAIEQENLEITFDNGSQRTQAILSRDSQQLVLQIVADPESNALFHQLHLKR